MKRLALITVALAAMALASAATAQDTVPNAKPAPATDAGYAARLDLAEKLIEANGGRRQMEVMMTSMIATPMKAVAAQLPEKDRRIFDMIQAKQQEMLMALLPVIIEDSKRAYASTFTQQELQDVLAFQLSPSGQAMIHKMPALTAKLMTDIMPVVIQQMPKMMNSVLVEVCNEQHCTAEQQQTIANLMAKSSPGRPTVAATPGAHS